MKKQHLQYRTDIERISELEQENKDLKEQLMSTQKQHLASQGLLETRRILFEHANNSISKFQTLFHRSLYGNKILGEDLKILEANDALVLMLGYTSKDELINRNIVEIAHPDFVNHWHELQEALWDRKIPTFSLDTCLVKKNGDSIWVRVSSILFEDQGATLGYTIVENISERKSLEQKLEQNYENQNLMVYMVAHDLRSPLHNILGLTNILKTITEQSPLTSKCLFYLALIEKSCIISELLIDDLILMGEIENEEIEIKNEDITIIIKDVIEAMTASVMEKQIHLTPEYPEDEVILPVNIEKLRRVVTNLVSNAIKFSKTGGSISITLKENPQDVLIVVSDKGIGIPLKLQDKVFDRFTQSKRKGTNGENTTGLGLYISKRIVERHNGTIWFESKEGEGSSFFVRIPK